MEVDPIVDVTKPALQTHDGAPVEFAGQKTVAQELLKNGTELVACTDPEKPLLHVQFPDGTLFPLLFAGQPTALQLEMYWPDSPGVKGTRAVDGSPAIV